MGRRFCSRLARYMLFFGIGKSEFMPMIEEKLVRCRHPKELRTDNRAGLPAEGGSGTNHMSEIIDKAKAKVQKGYSNFKKIVSLMMVWGSSTAWLRSGDCGSPSTMTTRWSSRPRL